MSVEQHHFDTDGYDLWGYNQQGHYDSRCDRRPFQASPYPTCAACDATTCPQYRGAS